MNVTKCKEVQSNILPFFQGKLDIKQLELFLDHIEDCETCREELEVYFTLHTAMQILEDKHQANGTNEKLDLGKELYRAREQCRRFHRRRVEKNALFVFLVVVTCVLIF